jgi:hypothetical protein
MPSGFVRDAHLVFLIHKARVVVFSQSAMGNSEKNTSYSKRSASPHIKSLKKVNITTFL